MKLTDTLVNKLVEKYDIEIANGNKDAKEKKESLKDFYKDWNTSRELSNRKTLAMDNIADDDAITRLYKLRDQHDPWDSDNPLEGGVFQNLPPTPVKK